MHTITINETRLEGQKAIVDGQATNHVGKVFTWSIKSAAGVFAQSDNFTDRGACEREAKQEFARHRANGSI